MPNQEASAKNSRMCANSCKRAGLQKKKMKILQTALTDMTRAARNCIQQRNAAMFQNLFTTVFLRRTSQNQGNKFM